MPAERPALVAGERVVSFVALAAESRRLARGLAALGLGRGDRVALWLPNVPEWLALYFVLARLGAAAVTLNTRFKSAEIGDILERAGCRALAFAPGFRHRLPGDPRRRVRGRQQAGPARKREPGADDETLPWTPARAGATISYSFILATNRRIASRRPLRRRGRPRGCRGRARRRSCRRRNRG
ncbi:MAG TPA: AMP-binding protein [Stellaceae bacterium]|nr:AMP-binding protein [Stellaceae bacterium]